MKVTIVAVGHRLAEWANVACEDYLVRLPPELKMELKQVKAEPRAGGVPVSRILSAEAARIRAAVPTGSLMIALDERGNNWTTQSLADQLLRWRDASQDIAFAIGGADGLDPGLKRDAHMQLRLSSMTLPHSLTRVMLAEQLYRASSMIAGHPYHRA
ncbi:MAG: 23S rRNA (pseudouridine(1915)-N(3))-methyltransferase RlmH [Burkholderiaceae bacterium]|nr:23S rRNA (pseudouridine(1915)-N(3))-methyltransferase RlmH [Burkholderiaceae bacterium]